MNTPIDDQGEFKRGFAAGFEAGRKSRRGLAHYIALAVLLYLAVLVLVNLSARPVH